MITLPEAFKTFILGVAIVVAWRQTRKPKSMKIIERIVRL